jgi:hypothetical protein
MRVVVRDFLAGDAGSRELKRLHQAPSYEAARSNNIAITTIMPEAVQVQQGDKGKDSEMSLEENEHSDDAEEAEASAVDSGEAQEMSSEQESASPKRRNLNSADSAASSLKDCSYACLLGELKHRIDAMDSEECFLKFVEMNVMARKELKNRSEHLLNAFDLMMKGFSTVGVDGGAAAGSGVNSGSGAAFSATPGVAAQPQARDQMNSLINRAFPPQPHETWEPKGGITAETNVEAAIPTGQLKKKRKFTLTERQEQFVKIIVAADEPFGKWASKARLKTGEPLFGEETHKGSLYGYARSCRHKPLKISFRSFRDGRRSGWEPLRRDEIDPLEWLMDLGPIRKLTEEEFIRQSVKPEKSA